MLILFQLSAADKSSRITSMKDPSISTSIPVIDLIDAIKPNSIDYDIVMPNATTAEVCSAATCLLTGSLFVFISTWCLPQPEGALWKPRTVQLYTLLFTFSRELDVRRSSLQLSALPLIPFCSCLSYLSFLFSFLQFFFAAARQVHCLEIFLCQSPSVKGGIVQAVGVMHECPASWKGLS